MWRPSPFWVEVGTPKVIWSQRQGLSSFLEKLANLGSFPILALPWRPGLGGAESWRRLGQGWGHTLLCLGRASWAWGRDWSRGDVGLNPVLPLLVQL